MGAGLFTVLALLLVVAPAGAQCPTDDATITAVKDANGNTLDPTHTLTGTLNIYWRATATAPTGWLKTGTSLDVFKLGATTPLHTLGQVGGLEADGSAYANWDTSIDTDGTYQVAVEHDWTATTGNPPQTCKTYSPRMTITVTNGHPILNQSSTNDELNHVCSLTGDAVQGHSATHPLTGGEDWSVPVTSWYGRGKRYEFALSYNSLSLVDPKAPTPPELTGLSEHNSKWSQPFCQWIDLFKDENNQTFAVWHHDGTYLSFAKSPSSNTFTAPDSFHTLTTQTVPTTTFSYTCGTSTTNLTLNNYYGSFTLKDAEQTEYDFTQVYWTSGVGPGGTGEALAHFLLTQIVDRWGRKLTITWTNQTVGSAMEPRVTAVKDDNNLGLTLDYGTSGGLLRSVTDPQGRVHTLAYSAVPDEETPVPPATQVTRQKLTGITVYGPGSPNRVVYTWSFLYQLPGDTTNAAYGGQYTGDLVVQKTEPDGLTVNYQYEPVSITTDPNTGRTTRPTSADWDGRVTQVSWPDSSEGPTVTRVITRLKDNALQATLTFPGGKQVKYNYLGMDLASVTDLATSPARVWSYTYDNHNLASVKTPLETGTYPLFQKAYQYTNGQISQITRTELLDGGNSMGHQVVTTFNGLNEPMQITAQTDTPGLGSVGHHDEATQFWYDNFMDGVSVGTTGKLTAVLRGWMDKSTTPATFRSLETTSLTYNGTAGIWGLPDSLTNPVGGVSSFLYDTTGGTGLPTSTATPANSIPEAGPADQAPSTTALQYNNDGMPTLVTDPMGHQVLIDYNAQAPGSANLVVTRTTRCDLPKF